MYALIYNEFDPDKREKRVISMHKTGESRKGLRATEAKGF